MGLRRVLKEGGALAWRGKGRGEAENVTGPTLWLKVSYLKPTPINEPLRFECRVDSVDGKKFSVSAKILHFPPPWR